MIQWLAKKLGLGTRTNDLTDDRWWSKVGYSTSPPAAGVEVSESTAMTYSAVWAATRLLCGTGGTIPLQFFSDPDGGTKTRLRKHPLQKVFSKKANPRLGAINFRRVMWNWQVNWGNAVALKILDADGQVDSLWPLQPWRLTPHYEGADLYWRYSVPDGGMKDYHQNEVFHVPNIITCDGTIGLGTIQAAREGISMGLATEKYGANFFGGDGLPRIAVSHPGPPLQPEMRRAFHSEWAEIHGGPQGKKVALLAQEAKVTQLTLSAEDSQFLATRQFNVEEIARWYGIPPHMLQRMVAVTYSNVEHLPIDFVTWTFLQYVRTWEESIDTQAVREDEQEEIYAKHNLNGLQRGDSAARSTFYQTMVSAGLMTRNEARALEEMEPVEGGDTFLVQGAQVPLDEDGKPESEFTGNAANQVPDEKPPAKTEDTSDSASVLACRSAARVMLTDALSRMAYKESTRAVRAADQPKGFIAWLDEYYGKHEQQLAEAIAPPLVVVSGDSSAIAKAWCERSRSELLEASGKVSAEGLPAAVAAAVESWCKGRVEAAVTELVV